ncbi:hypothetical protein BDA96_09G002300 [Sorghum bicolor]|uniref:DUF1664 domain-containing protein n=1 Tax=Sorghum bicolor TaxID=4558 RepID=A0A921Q799_SORBI|nr:uncharacterized protein LOC8066588 [Sorghum bicolor]KAG0516428.1 hypothetical protein BDA96_09G002300 [Sorghum bicolor]|eukprot:XP_021303614.1 uncharacterized protein LOC8066588 [Sorghum bicolor]
MVLGGVLILLGSGVAGSVLTGDAKLPKLGDVFSGATEFVKKHGKEGGATTKSGSSDQNQLLSQINNLREEIQTLATTPNTIVTAAANSGPNTYTITAIVVAGAIGYAYIKWKGWKLSDMMFVTKRGLAEACTAVGSHLDQVSDSVVVTRKHLAGRIDRVDISLDETQQIIEGTRDEVGIIHGDLSAFQEDLQSVNLVVRTLESKMGRLESSQDQTVDGINHLCEFTLKMEPSQNANVRQVSSSSIPAVMDSSSDRIVGRAICLPRLALEPPVSLVAESPRAETSMQVSPAAEGPETVSQEQEQEGVGRTCRHTRNREGASEEKSSHSHGASSSSSAAKAAITKTQNPSSSRLGGLWMPVVGTLLRASALS